jgi:hypothetical protein
VFRTTKKGTRSVLGGFGAARPEDGKTKTKRGERKGERIDHRQEDFLLC